MQADCRGVSGISDSMICHVIIDISHATTVKGTDSQLLLRLFGAISLFLKATPQDFKYTPAFGVAMDTRKCSWFPVNQYYFEQRVIDENMSGLRIFENPFYISPVERT